MTLAIRLAEHIRACFTGIWIESHEHADALDEIAKLCRQENWRLATWDLERGLVAVGQTTEQGGGDPLAALRSLPALADPAGAALLVLPNFHRFLNSIEIVQAVIQQLASGKQHRTFVVVLAPLVQIPVELEKQFVVLEHELPTKPQLADIARGVADHDGELPTDDQLDHVLDAASGLTRQEAENAFSLSLVRHGRLQADVLWELKSQMLKKSGTLALHRGNESFAALGGLENLKSFCTRALKSSNGHPLAQRRGVLLLSPPGCGKSQFAKALGNEVGRPTLTLDIGSLFGSLVGQSEQNMRQALRIVDAMAPCVLFCDELEKGLSGAGGSGKSDAGVTARLFGTLLTWLSDHTSDVFFVGTCNDVAKLPPEFARAERFDGVFFVDLPSAQQRAGIWKLYRALFGIGAKQALPDDADWTGAEIRACCRLATLLDVSLTQAAEHVVPIARTAAESVERLRAWAAGRCLSADCPGIYDRGATNTAGARRRVTRNSSNN